MTPWELQEEKELSRIFMRPERRYIFDKPTYPFFPPTPVVNFALRYKDQ